MTQVTAATPTLAFELNTEKWHMRIYRAADGTAIVERVRGGGKRCKPGSWASDRTPEGWVGIQRNAKQYAKVH